MYTSNQIRETFLEYFSKSDHQILPSGPLVPKNDPTLLFTNAGMVQFKNIFTGKEKIASKRVATSQKCIRAGGKHNDLENVGHTSRHHTFFEMLGNFSFGDYFKEDAIELSWNLISKIFALSKEKLLVTVYAEDSESFDLWKKISGLHDKRIIKIADDDNFWSMGNIGPCGPCSEIFYDHGHPLKGNPPGSGKQEGDRFVEIWNLVFMQYELLDDGNRVNLPNPSIDTGMGLERIAAVLQGVHDNYMTDSFKKIILSSSAISGIEVNQKNLVSFKIIADHLRSSSFLMADGVLPSNEGRGYVLRRIMRRAMRHIHKLECKKIILHQLVPTLIGEMGTIYPELVRAESLAKETLFSEEEKFNETLDKGMKILKKELDALKKGDSLDGEIAFKLYDTYGFPLDLTQDILKEKGIKVDEKAFNRAMDTQKERARSSWSGSGEEILDDIWHKIRDEVGVVKFTGYEKDSGSGKLKMILIDGKKVDKAASGDEALLIIDQTPFYGESGGQVGDTGTIYNVIDRKKVSKINVHDTQIHLKDLIVHHATIQEGSIAKNDTLKMEINKSRRNYLRANHSATHLLHRALRSRLGKHVTQKGSLVAPERLRFDFSHPRSVTKKELQYIETDVNHYIDLNTEVKVSFMDQKQAIEGGAMALFGEKYDDRVRVITMGESNQEDLATSVELCGGTHVSQTGEVGGFKITSESSVASGVRRIEALTGSFAEAYVRELEISKKHALKDQLAKEKAEKEEALQTKKKLDDILAFDDSDIQSISGINFLAKIIQDVPARELKSLVDRLKTKIESGVVVVLSVDDSKVSIVVGVTEDCSKKYDAVEIVGIGAKVLGGSKGGGRKDLAQSGGANTTSTEAAIQAIEKFLQSS